MTVRLFFLSGGAGVELEIMRLQKYENRRNRNEKLEVRT